MAMMFTEEFRPKSLNEVIGQKKAKDAVGSWFRTGRVPRAVLICGEYSAGKTTIARVVGRVMLCSGREEKDPTPCGKCRDCIAFGEEGKHPDYIEVNAASDRGIDAMKDLASKMRLMPLMGKKKILMLDEAHKITDAGWDAWLKPLEEPPAHVVIIIGTSEPTKVKETIKSRCSTVLLDPTPIETCAEILMAPCKKHGLLKMGITKDHLLKLAKAARGHPRNALHALDQVYTMLLDSQEQSQAIDAATVNGFVDQVVVTPVETAAAAIVKSILEGKPGGAMKRCEDLRAESDTLLSRLTELMRQAMYLSTSPKLMDPYYKGVFEGIPIFEHKDLAREPILDAFERFARLRIDCSNHTVPVAEVLDATVARAALIIQKFNKKVGGSPAPAPTDQKPKAPTTTEMKEAAPPPAEPKPVKAKPVEDSQDAPQADDDGEPAPVNKKNKSGTPTARLPQ
jgi:DNA polymerase III subunit gamma/tau